MSWKLKINKQELKQLQESGISNYIYSISYGHRVGNIGLVAQHIYVVCGSGNRLSLPPTLPHSNFLIKTPPPKKKRKKDSVFVRAMMVRGRGRVEGN